LPDISVALPPSDEVYSHNPMAAQQSVHQTSAGVPPHSRDFYSEGG